MSDSQLPQAAQDAVTAYVSNLVSPIGPGQAATSKVWVSNSMSGTPTPARYWDLEDLSAPVEDAYYRKSLERYNFENKFLAFRMGVHRLGSKLCAIADLERNGTKEELLNLIEAMRDMVNSYDELIIAERKANK